MKRPVVIVTRRFWEEPNATSVRLSAYARALREDGHEVLVLSRFPFSGLQASKKPQYQRRFLLRETCLDTRVWRFEIPGELGLESAWDGALQSLRSLGFPEIVGAEIIDLLYGFAAASVVALIRPSAVVIEQGPVWLASSALIASALEIPVVLHVSDVKSLAFRLGQYDRPAAYDLLERLERLVWTKADAVVFVTESTRRLAAQRLQGNVDHLTVIPNGAELDKLMPVDAEVRRRLKSKLGLSEDETLVVFAGQFSKSSDLATILRAAALLPPSSRLRFLLLGEGPQGAALERLAAELRLENVRFEPGVTLDQLGGVLGAADIAVCSEIRGLKYTIRSKLFAYMAMGLPVVAADDEGEVRALLKRSGAGMTFEPQNAESLLASIRQLASSPELARQMGTAGRAFVEKHHDRSLLAAQFAGIVRTAIERFR